MEETRKPTVSERVYLGEALIHLCEVSNYFDVVDGNGMCADFGALNPADCVKIASLADEAIHRIEILLNRTEG